MLFTWRLWKAKSSPQTSRIVNLKLVTLKQGLHKPIYILTVHWTIRNNMEVTLIPYQAMRFNSCVCVFTLQNLRPIWLIAFFCKELSLKASGFTLFMTYRSCYRLFSDKLSRLDRRYQSADFLTFQRWLLKKMLLVVLLIRKEKKPSWAFV